MKTNLRNQNAFTLVELVVTVTILGIVSYVAVSKFASTHTALQYETFLKKMASDVRYARDRAQTGGQGTRFYVDSGGNRYYLKWADGTALQDPVGGGDFIMQAGSGHYPGVVITATAFAGGRLDFNTAGIPANAGASFQGELTLATINGRGRIVVTANTGLVRIED